MAEPVGSRRDRQRAATETEIKTVARRQIAEVGSDGISLRGIARDMGMTAPGLYRYFASLDDLVEELCSDFFGEAAAAVSEAVREADPDVSLRMLVAIRAFRRWALEHPAEFSLMFRRRDVHASDEGPEHSRGFAQLFLELFVRLSEQHTLRYPTEVPWDACAQLDGFAQVHQIDLPPPALWLFASSWVRLYSVICLEVLGQLSFMFPDDVGPYFESELRAVAEGLGVAYQPPPAT